MPIRKTASHVSVSGGNRNSIVFATAVAAGSWPCVNHEQKARRLDSSDAKSRRAKSILNHVSVSSRRRGTFGVRARPRVAFALFEASSLLDLEIIGDFDPIRLERINRFHKGGLSVRFKPRCRTPRILIRYGNQAMFHCILVDVIQSREPRPLKRQVGIPEFIHHSPAGSAVNAVELCCQITVQMSHEITMSRRGIFERDHQMIVVGKERPSLQDESYFPARSKVVPRRRFSFAPESKSCFRCSVAAVTM